MNLKAITLSNSLAAAKNFKVADLQRRLQSRSVLAISLETNEITVALMRRENQEVRTATSCSVAIGADAAISEPERAGNALAEALDQAKIREKKCVVCLPPRWAMSSLDELPEVAGEDLKAFLELRAERDFAASAGELRLSHSAFTLPNGKQYATLAGVPARRLDALQQLLETAGLRAVSVALGLDRPAWLGQSGPSLQLIANCDSVDLIVAAGGGVTSMRTLPAPKDDKFDAASFVREVRITLGRLPDPVRKSISSARLSGASEGVARLVRETSEPLKRLGIATLETEPAGVGAHPAIDAAERFLSNEPVQFELVERETKPWQVALARLDAKQRRWILIGAVVLIVLPILTLMIRSHIESNLTEEWDAMKGEYAELNELQQRIRLFRPWFETTPQSLQCVETVASCFPEQGDLWAKSIQIGENGKVTIAGFSKNHSGIAELQSKLRKQPGVKDVQIQQVKSDKVNSFTIVFQWEGNHAS